MLRKIIELLKKFLHSKRTQKNIIKMLMFVRAVVATYAIEMVLEDIIKYFVK